MRVTINLASHPYEDLRNFWLRWGGGVAALSLLTLILLYLTAWGYAGASKDRELIREREQQIAARDQENTQAQALLNLPQNSSTRDRSEFLNDLFERKTFSWTRVFEDLERVMPAQLHVVSIHPEMDADNQLEIKLQVGGDSHEHALELVRKMEGSPRFKHTYIEKEHYPLPGEVLPGEARTDKVEFDIAAVYVPEESSSGHGGSQ